MKEIIKAKGKSTKTILAELKRRDFCTFDWSEDHTELEANDCFKGQVIRTAYIGFSQKGRATTDLVIVDR